MSSTHMSTIMGKHRVRPAHRLVRTIACLMAAGALVVSPNPAPAQSAPVTEYQLKAVFLFNFAQFVDWPPATFPDPHTPLVIGILGDDRFGGTLDETVRGEQVNDRPLVVQ